MPADFTGVIATIFEPPELPKLEADLKAAGAEVIVVRGMRTNAAWNTGLAQVKTRYAAVINDDVVVNEGWVDLLLGHHRDGYTHVAAAMWREMKAPVQPGARYLGETYHKGHLFSMDMAVDVPPVPADLQVFFGDDWFYWHHRYRGRTCVALDVQVKTGQDLGREYMSGYSSHHPDIEKFLGEPYWDVVRSDFKAATKYFTFPKDSRRPEQKVFAEAVPPPWGLVNA